MIYGYAQGEMMAQILETACENGALTREGLLEAFQSLDDVETEGLVAPLDFSEPGQPPAREVLILSPTPPSPVGWPRCRACSPRRSPPTYQTAG